MKQIEDEEKLSDKAKKRLTASRNSSDFDYKEL